MVRSSHTGATKLTGPLPANPSRTMGVFDYLLDEIDNYRAIAMKHSTTERLEFLQRFCEWKTVGGVTGWNPVFGYGRIIRTWMHLMLVEANIGTSVFGRNVIACLIAEFIETEMDETVLSVILGIARTDFPDGPAF